MRSHHAISRAVSGIRVKDLLACAIAATRSAAGHAKRNLSRRNEVARRFKHDVKLRLDIECQAKAEKVILSRFPEHGILGEEDTDGAGKQNADSKFEWVIDPIDGTVNFSHGLPYWCCSVAVRYAGKVVAGAVYSPVLNELYTAAIGAPACCNGKRIRVSRISAVGDSLVLTGLDKSIDRGVPAYSTFERMWEHVQRGRIMGSAALDICRVAAGQADAYFESGIYIWDVAAAGLIVRQSGGKVEATKEQAGHRMRFLATNGRIHTRMKSLLFRPAAR
jgi:myo-inositol-1(or 4)-monophosphatase